MNRLNTRFNLQSRVIPTRNIFIFPTVLFWIFSFPNANYGYELLIKWRQFHDYSSNLHGFALAKRARYQTSAKPSKAIPITINHLQETDKQK